MADETITRRVIVTPRTRIEADDAHPEGPRVRITTPVYDLALDMSRGDGDAGIIATTGALIDALETIRRSARARIAAAHTGLPAPTDGLDAATLAEALRGMAPGEITEAFGS